MSHDIAKEHAAGIRPTSEQTGRDDGRGTQYAPPRDPVRNDPRQRIVRPNAAPPVPGKGMRSR